MSNITLSVDDEIIKKVRKIAIDKNTSLTAMIREFLKSTAERDVVERGLAIKELDKSFAVHSRDMGKRGWTRADLHER